MEAVGFKRIVGSRRPQKQADESRQKIEVENRQNRLEPVFIFSSRFFGIFNAYYCVIVPKMLSQNPILIEKKQRLIYFHATGEIIR